MQIREDAKGKLVPIDVVSRKLNATEAMSSIFSKEALAIAMAGKAFYRYLTNSQVHKYLCCDNRSIWELYKKKNTSSTLGQFINCWVNEFQPANIIWTPSEVNYLADMLSREGIKQGDSQNEKLEFMNIFVAYCLFLNIMSFYDVKAT